MKILIVEAKNLFAEQIKNPIIVELQQQLNLAGHHTELLTIPFQINDFERLPSQLLMMRALELTTVDCVLALQFPTYFIRHPYKIVWLFDEPGHPCHIQQQMNPHLETLIKQADREAFAESRHVFTCSTTMQQQLEHYSDLKTKVLSLDLSWPEILKGLLQ